MNFSENHISMTTSSEVCEICKPLFNSTPISYFHYSRIYDDGTMASTVTSPRWHKHFLDNDFHLHSSHLITPGLCLTTVNDDYQVEVRDARLFNLHNKFEVTERCDGYYELFGYALPTEKSELINFYFNNLDILKKFNVYYKDKVSDLFKNIDMADRRIVLNDFETIQSDITNPNQHNIDEAKKLFMPQNNLDLTNREKECFQLTLAGNSAKQISLQLGISPKTVEFHIKRLKTKINCQKRSELYSYALKNNLIKLFNI